MSHRLDPAPRRPTTSLIQTTLDHWVSGVRLGRKPCYINRLPPELLIEIMAYMPFYTKCARRHCHPFQLPDRMFDEDDEDQPDPTPSFAPDTLSDCAAERRSRSGCIIYCPSGPFSWNWLEVMRVCKDWYSICHACPEFWTRVPMNSHTMVDRALKLSHGRPLCLAYTMKNGQLHGISRALDASRRIRELVVGPGYKGPVGRRTDYTSLAAKLKKQDARILQSFYFMSPYVSVDLRAPFRENHLPSLRRLHFSGVNLIQCQHLFHSNLVHLHLYECTGAWRGSSQLLEVLSGLTSLQTLRVLGDKTFPDFRPGDSHTATLPMLREVELHAGATRVLGFIEHVVFPSSATVHLEIYHKFPIPNCPDAARRFAAAFLKHYTIDDMRTASFTRGRFVVDYAGQTVEKFCMAQFDLDWDKDTRADSCPSSPKFIIRHFWDGNSPKAHTLLNDVDQLFCTYSSALPNFDMRTLRIIQLGNPPLSKRRNGSTETPRVDLWFSGLRHLSRVRTLIVADEPLETLLWLESPANRSEPPFPVLRTWKFADCFLEGRLFRTVRSQTSVLHTNHDYPHLDLRATVADAVKSQLALRASTFGSEIALHSIGSYTLRDNLEDVFLGSRGVGSIEEGDYEEDLDDGDEENEPRWFD